MITGELGEEKQRGQPMFFPNLEILSWNYLNSKIISQIRGPRLKHQIIRIKIKHNIYDSCPSPLSRKWNLSFYIF